MIKKDNSAKAIRRREQAAKLQGKGIEPDVIEGDKVSFGNALSWYSRNTNSKDQKKYAMEYFKLHDKKVEAKLKKLPDWAFGTLGSVCRLKMREQWLEPNSTWFEKRVAELIERADKVAEPSPTQAAAVDKPVIKPPTIQERIREKASEVAGEIEGEIDDFCDAGYPAKATLNTSLKGLGAPILKIIADFYRPQLAEMQEALAGTCDQLNEGYSHMKKIDKKRYIAFIEHIIQSAEQGIVSAKATRKPRVRKPKPPAMIVKNLKYKVKDDDLNLRSDDRLKLAECSEVWVYNTKNRKMTLYVPDMGGVMSIKGTTLTGFDIVKSQSKTLRKPEVLKAVNKDAGKRAMANLWKTITTKPSRPNGRINEETILLRIF